MGRPKYTPVNLFSAALILIACYCLSACAQCTPESLVTECGGQVDSSMIVVTPTCLPYYDLRTSGDTLHLQLTIENKSSCAVLYYAPNFPEVDLYPFCGAWIPSWGCPRNQSWSVDPSPTHFDTTSAAESGFICGLEYPLEEYSCNNYRTLPAYHIDTLHLNIPLGGIQCSITTDITAHRKWVFRVRYFDGNYAYHLRKTRKTWNNRVLEPRVFTIETEIQL